MCGQDEKKHLWKEVDVVTQRHGEVKKAEQMVQHLAGYRCGVPIHHLAQDFGTSQDRLKNLIEFVNRFSLSTQITITEIGQLVVLH